MVLFASPETAAIEYFGYLAPVSQLLQNVLMGTRLRIVIPRDTNHIFNIPETSCSIHAASCPYLLHYRETTLIVTRPTGRGNLTNTATHKLTPLSLSPYLCTVIEPRQLE